MSLGSLKTWQKIVIVVAVLAAIGLVIPKGKKEESPKSSTSVESVADESSTHDEVDQKQQRRDRIAAFASAFNDSSELKIEGSSEFDPQDKNGTEYRTEFRGGSWRDSVGSRAKCGNCTVDIIAYGDVGLRVYAEGPSSEVAAIFTSTAKIMDSKATQESIDKAIEKAKSGGGNGLTIEGTDINPAILIIGGENGEMMLDYMHYEA